MGDGSEGRHFRIGGVFAVVIPHFQHLTSVFCLWLKVWHRERNTSFVY